MGMGARFGTQHARAADRFAPEISGILERIASARGG